MVLQGCSALDGETKIDRMPWGAIKDKDHEC